MGKYSTDIFLTGSLSLRGFECPLSSSSSPCSSETPASRFSPPSWLAVVQTATDFCPEDLRPVALRSV